MAYYPANPSVLRSARELRSLTVEEAAQLLGIDPETLRALESGEQQPTLTVLRAMSNKYRLPLATLGHSEPLQPPERVTDFRTVESAPAVLSLELSVALDEARQLQEFAAELAEEDQTLYRRPALPTATLRDDPERVAADERRRLRYGSMVQLHTRDTADALNYLRTRIEGEGVFVYFVKGAPPTDFRGFCLLGGTDEPPVIGVNDEENVPGATLFTLVHEYCHLLLRAPGVSGHELRNPTERYCNRFAAGFLMPVEVLREVLPLRDRPTEWDSTEIAEGARQLRVSQQALALRLEELGQAPPGFYEAWLARYEGPPSRQITLGPVPWERRVVRRFGTGYPDLVFSALDRGVITQLDAYRLLKVKPEHFNRVRREVTSRRERVAAAGA